jgi:hypothetical protein
MELAPVVMRRLCKELRDLTTEKSIDGIKVLVDEQVGKGLLFTFHLVAQAPTTPACCPCRTSWTYKLR